MLLRIRTPATNDRGPLYAEHAFAALHQVNHRRLSLRLIFDNDSGSVGLFVADQNILKPLVEEQFYANYPNCLVDNLPADALDRPYRTETWSIDLVLSPDLFPCRRYGQFEDVLNRVTADPLTGILATIGHLNRIGLSARLELVVRPAGYRRPAQAKRTLHHLGHPYFRARPRRAHRYAAAAMSPHLWKRIVARILALPARRRRENSGHTPLNVSGSRLHEGEYYLQAASDKLGRQLYEARLRASVSGPASRTLEIKQRVQDLAGSLGHFNSPRLAAPLESPASVWRAGPTFLLSCEELATLFHPPNSTIQVPHLAQVSSRELAAPKELAEIAKRSQTERGDIAGAK